MLVYMAHSSVKPRDACLRMGLNGVTGLRFRFMMMMAMFDEKGREEGENEK